MCIWWSIVSWVKWSGETFSYISYILRVVCILNRHFFNFFFFDVSFQFLFFLLLLKLEAIVRDPKNTTQVSLSLSHIIIVDILIHSILNIISKLSNGIWLIHSLRVRIKWWSVLTQIHTEIFKLRNYEQTMRCDVITWCFFLIDVFYIPFP